MIDLSGLGNIAQKGADLSGKLVGPGIIGATAVGKFQKFFGGNDTPPTSSQVIKDTGIPHLSEFIANVKNEGLAQTNNFAFIFTPPKKVIDYGDDIGMQNDRMVSLLCYSADLPSINIATAPIRYFGEIIDMPNDKNYGGFSSTFYVDTSMYVKLFFDRWISTIQNPYSRNFNYYDDYTANLMVKVFDKHGLEHYRVYLDNAFPKSIGAISMSQDSRDIMKVTIEWSYRRYTTSKIENSVKAGAEQVGTEPKQSMSQRLMGYAGQFKDYQNRFNNMSGDISRTQSLIKNGDWGGLVGQNTGGAWF